MKKKETTESQPFSFDEMFGDSSREFELLGARFRASQVAIGSTRKLQKLATKYNAEEMEAQQADGDASDNFDDLGPYTKAFFDCIAKLLEERRIGAGKAITGAMLFDVMPKAMLQKVYEFFISGQFPDPNA